MKYKFEEIEIDLITDVEEGSQIKEPILEEGDTIESHGALKKEYSKPTNPDNFVEAEEVSDVDKVEKEDKICASKKIPNKLLSIILILAKGGWRIVVFLILVIVFIITAYRVLGFVSTENEGNNSSLAAYDETSHYELSPYELQVEELTNVIKVSEEISQSIFELNSYENVEFSRYVDGRHTDASLKIAIGVSERRKKELLSDLGTKLDQFSSDYSQPMYLISQMRLVNGLDKSRVIIDGVDERRGPKTIKKALNDLDINDTALKLQYNEYLTDVLDVIDISYEEDEFNVYFILR